MTVFVYKGYHGCESKCEIEIQRMIYVGRVVVVATELPDNPGTSITNMAEQLATQVCRAQNIAPQHLVWIEHYPGGSWDLVTFGWDWRVGAFAYPEWRPLALADDSPWEKLREELVGI